MRRRTLLAAALAAPSLARAQQAAVAWQATFASWASRSGVQRGAIVAMRQGRAVHASGLGGQPPSARAPLWSLSKLVTGSAAAQLIGEGRVRLDTRLGAAMPATFRDAGVAVDGPLGSLTLAQLLTQRTGIPTRPDGEAMPGLSAQIAASGRPAAVDIAALRPAVMAVRPTAPAGGAFAYSNTNFLLLGLMLAEQRHAAYAPEAAARVLAPAGIRGAALDPDWRALDAGGGWRLSPAEYLAFVYRTLGPQGVLAPDIVRWLRDPADKRTTPGGPVHYALGSFVRPVAGGFNFFHDGSWTWNQRLAGGTTIAASAASRFVLAADGAAWCAVFSPNPGNAASAELDQLMWGPLRNAADEGTSDLLPSLLRDAA